jgi:hypothetical protein
MERLDIRRKTLTESGAGADVIDTLLAYNENVFDRNAQEQLRFPLRFPLEDEPFVAVWREYAAETAGRDAFGYLQSRLVQFGFPIEAGMSETDPYRNATRRGIVPDGPPGLALARPDLFRIEVHPTAAGSIPILLTGDRQDFVTAVRALTRRNEPAPIQDSMGACMVSGYNNWDRVRRLRMAFESKSGGPVFYKDDAWQSEWLTLIPRKELYQDRFIILSDGYYSGVEPAALHLSPGEWRRLSLAIRREHESTHYFTRRVLNSMRNNLLDEFIADYVGVVSAAGRFRAHWFLHFMGLESCDTYRPGGRLENYGGEPPLPDACFRVLQILVRKAASNLERFDREARDRSPGPAPAEMILALTEFTLEELASDEAPRLLAAGVRRQQAQSA